jgi:thioredoxin-related protein
MKKKSIQEISGLMPSPKPIDVYTVLRESKAQDESDEDLIDLSDNNVKNNS